MIAQRIFPISLFLTVLAGAVPANAAASLSGVWAIAGGPPWTCTLKQNGKLLAGDCKGVVLQGPASGGVNGNKVNWTWQAKSIPGGPEGSVTITFAGQWDSKDAITGGHSVASNPTGQLRFPPDPQPFTASRQATPAK